MTTRRRLVAAPALLLAIAVVSGCTSAPDGGTTATPQESSSSPAAPSASATPTGLESFYDQKLAWKGCGGSFQCADLTVPLDYADPAGATIAIAVVKLPASGDKVGSLVLNPGGPGSSGVDYARAARAVVDKPVRERYDVVGFDPRGVVRSEGMVCLDDEQTDVYIAADATPDDAAEIASTEKLNQEFADACQAKSSKMLSHVSTRDAARDIDILRAALGDEKLNWLGASYGTMLGATYADLFPDKVGRMVLDGALDPTLSNEELAHGQAKGFDVALRRFIEDCATQADCPLPRDTQQAVDRMVQWLAELDQKPLATGDPKRPLTEGLALNAVLSYLYFPPFDWEQLRFGLQLAFEGDGSVLLSMLDARLERGENGKYKHNPLASFISVNALDRPDRPTVAQAQELADEWGKEAPVFGPALAWASLVYSAWPVPAVDAPKAITAPGTGPILVVGTTYDPATPYPWAQALAKQLENGVLLTRVGDGHTGYGMGSECIDDAIDTYLVEGTPPAEDTVCR